MKNIVVIILGIIYVVHASFLFSLISAWYSSIPEEVTMVQVNSGWIIPVVFMIPFHFIIHAVLRYNKKMTKAQFLILTLAPWFFAWLFFKLVVFAYFKNCGIEM